MVMTADELEDALDIRQPEDDRLRLDDCRRMTGPGMLWARPGAIADILIDGFDRDAVADAWEEDARRIMDLLGWTTSRTTRRLFEDGINVALSAPVDQLYTALYVAQTAWHFAASRLLGVPSGSFDAMVGDLIRIKGEEINPALLALEKRATAEHVDFVPDYAEVSVGHGTGHQVWPLREIPSPDSIDWTARHNVPIALITGTNGKSTSVRLSAAIAESAGLVAGVTSTDYVKIGDQVLDYGDYSGPGGARMLLRDSRLEIAFLEVARGGILRRGLPLKQAQAALVTNIAADHLGQYGVNTVEALAHAKFAVARALVDDGTLVLNADDPLVVQTGLTFDKRICWFSLDKDNPHVAGARDRNAPCCWLDGKVIFYSDGETTGKILNVSDIPITMDGAARYNVSNAMGVIALAAALGISRDAIIGGLSGFRSVPEDNPGRCNEFAVAGARVFVDFAHNPHSIDAVADALSHLPAGERYILLGHAGDRSDHDIRDLTDSALSFGPDHVIVVEMETYLRGRELSEITGLIRDRCLERGVAEDAVRIMPTPTDGVRHVLDRIKPGDVALLLVLTERDAVFEILKERAG